MKSTIPISDLVPLAEWILRYHGFRARFDKTLRRTGKTPAELHHEKLGPEASPGVWEGDGYRVYVGPLAVSFEVPEGAKGSEALEAFERYQDELFGPKSEPDGT